jgi:hypothetical protein
MAKISLTDGKMSGLILSDLIELIKDAKAFCKYKTEMIPIQVATCPCLPIHNNAVDILQFLV